MLNRAHIDKAAELHKRLQTLEQRLGQLDASQEIEVAVAFGGDVVGGFPQLTYRGHDAERFRSMVKGILSERVAQITEELRALGVDVDDLD